MHTGNVGIGTTNPDAAVGAGNTAKLSVGILSAYQLYGDGSNLTGISGGGSGFSPDSQENLAAGTSAGASKDADTCFNIFLGYKAGTADCAGDNNVYIGCCAGVANLSGDNNVFIGAYAGKGNTTGYKNVQIGYNAGPGYSGTGYCNVYLGVNPAGGNTNGQHNFIAGYQAGYSGSSGAHNFIVGQLAFTKVCSSDNVAIGEYAGYGFCNQSGDNILIGKAVATSVSGGGRNIMLGHGIAGGGSFVGNSGSNVCENVVLGYKALYCGTSPCRNTIIGTCAGCTMTSGKCNVLIGYGVTAVITGDTQFKIGIDANKWICGDTVSYTHLTLPTKRIV